MLLAANPSFEIVRFLQILVWIIVPIMASAIAMTIYLHYRRKKKVNRMAEQVETNFILASPEQFSHNKQDGDYIFFDHSGLIREYKDRMFYNHARYAALRKDYAVLEAKYTSLATDGKKLKSLITSKKIYMKNRIEQLPDAGNSVLDDATIERKEMADKLEQLSRSYQRLEEENRFLQEQLSLQTANDEEKEKIVNRWKEEHKLLVEKITEKEYLEELLEEKKSQIVFLQNQLEQRIRNQHQSDQQRQQVEHLHQGLLEEMETMKNELQLKQDEADQLQMMICQKEEEAAEGKQVIGAKQDHITWIENTLHETKQQNELLNAELADKKDELTMLQTQLADERARLELVIQKLASKNQAMQRLYREFSACMNAEQEISPVIALKPSYLTKLNEEWDETTAVH
jgi:chromosome segregation ATPase